MQKMLSTLCFIRWTVDGRFAEGRWGLGIECLNFPLGKSQLSIPKIIHALSPLGSNVNWLFRTRS